MDRFSWGRAFIDINRDLLDQYSACKDGEEVLAVQNKYLEKADKEKEEKEKSQLEKKRLGGGYNDDMDLPPSESDSDCEEED